MQKNNYDKNQEILNQVSNFVTGSLSAVGMTCYMFGNQQYGNVCNLASHCIGSTTKLIGGFVSSNNKKEEDDLKIDDFLGKKCVHIDAFSPKTDADLYNSFIYFLFTKNNYQFIKEGEDDLKIGDLSRKDFFNCNAGMEKPVPLPIFKPETSFLYFIERRTKYIVKMENFLHHNYIMIQIYVKNEGKVDEAKNYFLSEFKKKIKTDFDTFFQTSGYYKIKAWSDQNQMFSQISIKKKQTNSDVKHRPQNFLRSKIKENQNKIVDNTFSLVLVLGNNNIGKSYASKLIADDLQKPLYVINPMMKKRDLQLALDNITEPCVLDISDIAHDIYSVGEVRNFLTQMITTFWFLILSLVLLMEKFFIKINKNTEKIEKQFEEYKRNIKQKILKAELEPDNFEFKKQNNDKDVLTPSNLRMIIENPKKQVLIIFSANKTYFNYYRSIPGFLKRISLIVDFDQEDEKYYEIPNMWKNDRIITIEKN